VLDHHHLNQWRLPLAACETLHDAGAGCRGRVRLVAYPPHPLHLLLRIQLGELVADQAEAPVALGVLRITARSGHRWRRLALNDNMGRLLRFCALPCRPILARLVRDDRAQVGTGIADARAVRSTQEALVAFESFGHGGDAIGALEFLDDCVADAQLATPQDVRDIGRHRRDPLGAPRTLLDRELNELDFAAAPELDQLDLDVAEVVDLLDGGRDELVLEFAPRADLGGRRTSQ